MLCLWHFLVTTPVCYSIRLVMMYPYKIDKQWGLFFIQIGNSIPLQALIGSDCDDERIDRMNILDNRVYNPVSSISVLCFIWIGMRYTPTKVHYNVVAVFHYFDCYVLLPSLFLLNVFKSSALIGNKFLKNTKSYENVSLCFFKKGMQRFTCSITLMVLLLSREREVFSSDA